MIDLLKKFIRSTYKYILCIIILVSCIIGYQKHENINNISKAYQSGNGTLEQPFVLKNNNNKLKEKLDQKIIDYMNDPKATTIDVKENGRQFLGNIDSTNHSIFIKEIRCTNALVSQVFLTLNDINTIPKDLFDDIGQQTISQKINRYENITETNKSIICDTLGDYYSSTISQKEEEIIKDSIQHQHGIIVVTYLIQESDHWYTSSLMYEWVKSELQEIDVPNEILEYGNFIKVQ